MTAECHILASPSVSDDVREFIRRHMPDGDFRRIVIKPNWVRHQVAPEFPIRALVTSPLLIEAVIAVCLDRYPQAESLTVADVPLQSCRWDLLAEQCGLAEMAERCGRLKRPRVRFLDLRRERYVLRRGFLSRDVAGPEGDPRGYRDVVLGRESFVDPVSDPQGRLRVSDYDPARIANSHRSGMHRYCIAGTILDADLVINMPKMKTHQKAGITGALKNLVGMNGEKGCLVHHRRGRAGRGGDEFPRDISFWIPLQARARELLQKRSRFGYWIGRFAWAWIKAWTGIRTEGRRENLGKRFYTGSGSWYGNDTVWRMVYDLNRILRYAPRDGGTLATRPQRAYVAVLDGIIAGEGDGPLQPLPVETGVVAVSANPFLVDMAMARMMGYDWRKIPLLANFRTLGDPEWSAIDPDRAQLSWDGRTIIGIMSLPVLHPFLAPPGWKGHIEL
ncbi:MAG: DUF362 domain-containing protein [Verrucomicrobiota bacterium]|nr:DUF362 domain-containing protein [Verrucomicrobiota bacterium]